MPNVTGWKTSSEPWISETRAGCGAGKGSPLICSRSRGHPSRGPAGTGRGPRARATASPRGKRRVENGCRARRPARRPRPRWRERWSATSATARATVRTNCSSAASTPGSARTITMAFFPTCKCSPWPRPGAWPYCGGPGKRRPPPRSRSAARRCALRRPRIRQNIAARAARSPPCAAPASAGRLCAGAVSSACTTSPSLGKSSPRPQMLGVNGVQNSPYKTAYNWRRAAMAGSS
jgi:hypothetical protein